MSTTMSSICRNAADCNEYVNTYKALSGQPSARDALVTEIMKAAKTRSALASDAVGAASVKRRLNNALVKMNAKAKAEMAAEEEEDE